MNEGLKRQKQDGEKEENTYWRRIKRGK